MIARLFALLGIALLPGCADADDDDGDEVAEVSVDECASGLKWVGGNEESPLMRPGGDCIECHTREDEGPQYLVSGTVYDRVAEPDDCFGREGVAVEVTDAEGSVWEMTTNDAGNFWIERRDGPVVFPFSAKIVVDGTDIPMVMKQSTGSCASCHTQMGANLAVGRIFVP